MHDGLEHLGRVGPQAALDQAEVDVVGRVRDPVEARSIEPLQVDIAQEVARGDRRLGGFQIQGDHALGGLQGHAHQARFGLCKSGRGGHRHAAGQDRASMQKIHHCRRA